MCPSGSAVYTHPCSILITRLNSFSGGPFLAAFHNARMRHSGRPRLLHFSVGLPQSEARNSAQIGTRALQNHTPW
jgi:hypothetical protein